MEENVQKDFEDACCAFELDKMKLELEEKTVQSHMNETVLKQENLRRAIECASTSINKLDNDGKISNALKPIILKASELLLKEIENQ